MPEAAAELVALAAAHALFIQQFDTWRDYVSDAVGDPSSEMIAAAIAVARSTRDEQEIIADDVSISIGELADAAEQPSATNQQDRPPKIVERELLRSVGNILSGLLAPLVKLARDVGSNVREGALKGFKVSANATVILAFTGSAYALALAAGLPGDFGWITPVINLLKMVFKM